MTKTVPIWNPQWNANMYVSKALFDRMKAHGFAPYHTGGGCMAWQKLLTDDGQECLSLTFVDVTLGETAKDAATPEWIIGRYLWVGTNEGWICHHGLTLTEALKLAPTIPQPKHNDEVMVEH